MSSNSTDGNHPYCIGYPVAPPGYNITIGIPAAENTTGSSTSNNRINNINPNPPPRPRINNIHDTNINSPIHPAICACIACMSMIFVSGLFVVFFMLASEPYINNHPDFYINSMLLSPLSINTSTSQFTANWTIGILANNTNTQVAIAYRKFEVSVLYDKDHYLCNTRVAPFHQGSENVTKLTVQPQAWFQSLERSVAISIAADEAIKGEVNFDVKLEVNLEYIGKIFRRKLGDSLNAACMSVKVRFPSNSTQGIMIGNPKRCITEGRRSGYYKNDQDVDGA